MLLTPKQVHFDGLFLGFLKVICSAQTIYSFSLASDILSGSNTSLLLEEKDSRDILWVHMFSMAGIFFSKNMWMVCRESWRWTYRMEGIGFLHQYLTFVADFSLSTIYNCCRCPSDSAIHSPLPFQLFQDWIYIFWSMRDGDKDENFCSLGF